MITALLIVIVLELFMVCIELKAINLNTVKFRPSRQDWFKPKDISKPFDPNSSAAKSGHYERR